jgi:NDP-sugar pyrophosphorylase family protein
MKAMILAAGLGTRLKPWTDFHPKALAVVNGKSLLQRNIEYLRKFGIKDVVVNVHHFADQITDAINNNNGWGSIIEISDERDEVLETGGGLVKASSFLKDEKAFVLMNVDILTDVDLGQMISYHQAHSPLATLATSTRKSSRYLLFNGDDILCGWRNVETMDEKKSRTYRKNKVEQRAFNGIHVIDPRLFSLVTQQGKFSMIDLYLSLMDEYVIKSYDVSLSTFIDVGKPQSLAAAAHIFS